jgi:hypothetical protein
MADQGAVADTVYKSPYKSPWKLLLPSNLDTIVGSASSAPCGDLNCKHPTWNSRADNSNGYIFGAYADEHELGLLGPWQPTNLTTTDTMDVLDVAILKAIRLKGN